MAIPQKNPVWSTPATYTCTESLDLDLIVYNKPDEWPAVCYQFLQKILFSQNCLGVGLDSCCQQQMILAELSYEMKKRNLQMQGTFREQSSIFAFVFCPSPACLPHGRPRLVVVV